MALITCPECSQQISDQAASCPHCGYPVQPASSTQVAPARVVFDKKIMRIVVVLVVLVVIGVLAGIGYAVNQYMVRQAELEQARQSILESEQTYIRDLKSIANDMLQTMREAENITYINEKVWRHAIFKELDDETRKYMFNGYGYNTLDVALSLFAADKEIARQRTAVKTSSSKIQARINALVVPDKYKDLHTEFIALHVTFLRYVDFVDLVGSYESYSEAIVTNSERFIELYRTIDQKIPK